MGRFNWVLRIIRKASVVGVICVLAITTTPKAAMALDATDDGYKVIGAVGTCEIRKRRFNPNLRRSGDTPFWCAPAGGQIWVKDKYWYNGGVSGAYNYKPFADVLNECVSSSGEL